MILSCHFLSKNRYVDSMETVYYRPESNAEYVCGVFIAFISVFGGAAVLSLLMIMVMHLLFMPILFVFDGYAGPCIHAGTFFFCYYLVKESGVEYDSSPWIFSVHDILYFRLSIRFV